MLSPAQLSECHSTKRFSHGIYTSASGLRGQVREVYTKGASGQRLDVEDGGFEEVGAGRCATAPGVPYVAESQPWSVAEWPVAPGFDNRQFMLLH